MLLWHFISRLWKYDKLLLVSLVLLAGLFYPMVTWAVSLYPHQGWRALFYPAGMAYVLLRLIHMARERVDRGVDHNESATVDEDRRMERVFRKGAKQEFDELVAEEGPKQEARRRTLWAEAASSIKTARQLQREIQGELEAIDDIMRYMVKRTPNDKAGIQDIALRRKEIEQELARAADLIHHLHA
jgi:hypothetical protein